MVLALVLAVAFILLRLWQGPEVPGYRIEPMPLVQTVVATGRVVSVSRALIGSELTGVVLERRVQEGDKVLPGNVLLVLREDDIPDDGAAWRIVRACLQKHSNRPSNRRSWLAMPSRQPGWH
jgi:multidrug efflux pump subunit AcrA (membrane-fusion protein)